MRAPDGPVRPGRIVSAGCVRMSESPATIPVLGHTSAPREQPRIDLVEEGEVVRAIDVTCACGCRIRIVCEYEGALQR